MDKPIAIACDAAGFALKQSIIQHLKQQNIVFEDFGSFDDVSNDYPDFAKPACDEVASGRFGCALLFCGTGVGMSIAANKVAGIRACCCSDIFSAEMTRRHNDANVLCLGARVVGNGLAEKLVDIFLTTPFEGGRHQRRVDKITAIEKAAKQDF